MEIRIDAHDHALDAFLQHEIVSDLQKAVRYRPIKRLGEGGSAVAFLALRRGPEGECPVVVKILRPALVRQLGQKAILAIQKEAVSLGRLNEQTPPTPFVVRLLDTGILSVSHSGRQIGLAWVALEYVHGGPEGTTLADRVAATVEATGAGFTPARAAHAIECLAAGLGAVHGVGVTHRDFKPDNVLCCGSGDNELFKIADFGIARPEGLAATFGLFVGTPGYAAPELAGLDANALGPWTDVFGLACSVFFILTGEPYFLFDTVGHAVALARTSNRRRLLECSGLCAELRGTPDACAALDAALARATSPEPSRRTPSASAISAELIPTLREVARRRPSSRHRFQLASTDVSELGGLSWSVLQHPIERWKLRSVAWDGDGRCLALAPEGLVCWDGISWRSMPGIPDAGSLRFTYNIGAGRWLLGGDAGTVARFEEAGETSIVQGDPEMAFSLAAGDLDDMAVLVGSTANRVALYVLVGRRWMRPFPFPEVCGVSAVAGVDDARWLVVGQTASGGGHAALFSPLDREVLNLAPASIPVLHAAAGDRNARQGIAVGERGAVVRWTAGGVAYETIAEEPRLTAVSLGPGGVAWAGGEGSLWMRRDAAGSGRWTCAWAAPRIRTPFVSVAAAPGLVRAVTVDGAVVEGRRDG